jgi:hypothetical protein
MRAICPAHLMIFRFVSQIIYYLAKSTTCEDLCVIFSVFLLFLVSSKYSPEIPRINSIAVWTLFPYWRHFLVGTTCSSKGLWQWLPVHHNCNDPKFEVLTAVKMPIVAVRVVTPCSCGGYQWFGGTYRLHFLVWKWRRNVGNTYKTTRQDTALQPRRPQSTYCKGVI